MLANINQTDSTGKVTSTLLATMKGTCPVVIQVKGAVSVSFANTREELDQNANGLVFGGIEITPAMGIVTLWWTGELWALPSANGATVSVQIP